MAFITPEELLAGLPADGDPLTLDDARDELTRWMNSLKFAPVSAREKALAEMAVERGAFAALQAKQARETGRGIPKEMDDRIEAAHVLRREYDSLRGGRRSRT